MTLEEAIEARHSVRNYKHQPFTEEVTTILQQKIDECNRLGNVHMKIEFKKTPNQRQNTSEMI